LSRGREVLERWQVLIYALAVASGALLGLMAPSAGGRLASTLWPLLAALLFVTFLQVPLAGRATSTLDRRYLGALLAGNFVAVPLLVWCLSRFMPDDPSLRLGFFVVLLVPCTDWFTTFTHLGRGDARLALASTPILLLLQMCLLPAFLWLLLGPEATTGMRAAPFLQAFVGIILAPLAAATWIERRARSNLRLVGGIKTSAWFPIPLLGLVMFVIAASEIHGVLAAAAELIHVVALFIAFLLLAPFLALAVSRWLALCERQARTLVFSLGTRNSFVVLPLVLAWPDAGPLAASVVVIQSLVELCGMLAYVAIVPRWVYRTGALQSGR
jgi:ACR3 family arsenite transporter